MDFFTISPLVFAIGIFLSGYYGGYSFNIEYRDDTGGLKRVVIPQKWKWLFHLKWEEVLMYSVVMQLIAWICAVLSLIGGYLLCCFFSRRSGEIFSFILMMAYGCFLLFSSIIVTVRYYRNFWMIHRKAKRCWSCELKENMSIHPIECKVYVVSKVFDHKERKIYQIQYGRWIKRKYEAVASKGYIPKEKTYARALYTSERPYFVLVSAWNEMQ